MVERPARPAVDMSPAAVAHRLEQMGQLYRLGVSLKAARRLGPVHAPRDGGQSSPPTDPA